MSAESSVGPYGWPESDDVTKEWPIPMGERARLALAHEPEASASPDGFRLATCVVPTCKRPMVAMWHLWLDWTEARSVTGGSHLDVTTRYVKEIHMCHQCATDIYGAPTPMNDHPSGRQKMALGDDDVNEIIEAFYAS